MPKIKINFIQDGEVTRTEVKCTDITSTDIAMAIMSLNKTLTDEYQTTLENELYKLMNNSKPINQ